MAAALFKSMTRALFFFFAFSLAAFAADFWIAKPYTEWTDKEAARLLSNSPWAHTVTLGAGPALSDAAGVLPGPSSAKVANNPADAGPGAMDAVGTLPDGTRRPGDPPSVNSGPTAEAQRVTVRWHSSVPIKQALLVRKGRTDLTSLEDAKRILEAAETHYVVAMSFNRMSMPLGEALRAAKENVRATAWLNSKGKDPIQAERVEFAGSQIFVFFPRSRPITVDDKEVEFRAATASGPVQSKFRLKDMLVSGKLSL